jgi:hypothetical protein
VIEWGTAEIGGDFDFASFKAVSRTGVCEWHRRRVFVLARLPRPIARWDRS